MRAEHDADVRRGEVVELAAVVDGAILELAADEPTLTDR
jgi:hypothetical protein